MSAIVVPDLGGETIEAVAQRRLPCNDCVVLVVATAEHKMRIETGRDARRSLTDEAALRILDDRMRPLLREGRTDDAIDAGISAIEDALRAHPGHPRARASDTTIAGVLVAAIVVLLVGAFALGAGARGRARRRSDGHTAHVPFIDAGSGSSGFSGGGGATSSW